MWVKKNNHIQSTSAEITSHYCSTSIKRCWNCNRDGCGIKLGATTLHFPVPTKVRVKLTTLGITAIETPLSTRITPILLLRIQRYEWRITKPQFFPASKFSTQHLHQDVIFFCYRWWLVLQHKTTSKDADVWHTSTDVHSLKPPYWWLFGDGTGLPVRYTTGLEPSVTWTSQHAWGNHQLLVSHSNATNLLVYWGQ